MLNALRQWRWFWTHLIVFVSLMAAGILLGGESIDTPWLGIIWMMIVGAHFLTSKSLNVDENWGEVRAHDIRQKTYDHKHIDQIVNSAVNGDPNEDPAAPKR